MATLNTRRSTKNVPQKSGYRRAVFSLTGFAALAWLALWLGGFFSTPKEVLEMRALVDAEVVKLDQMARNEVPYSNDWSSMGEVFGRMRDMPDGVRDQVREEVGRLFRARERAELGSYFALPPEKRQAELDRRIKAEQARAKAREQERASRVANAATDGGQRQGRQPGQGEPPAPAGGQRPGGGGPPGQRGARSDEQIQAWRKARLDRSSPEERARSAEYRRAMTVRREQLGISPGRGRGA
jgi:hypothetical protein